MRREERATESAMAELLIWVSLAVLVYVHFGYPLLLYVWRARAARPVGKAACEPTVTILIAAHNERERIEQKIANCFELDYPREKLQVIVALDAPTDGTEEVVWKYAGRSVDVVYYSPHKGKAGALNRGVTAAEGEILVFADARQTFDRAALRELVANFSDPSVGAVSGELVLLDEDGREASTAVGLYWRYEKWLRSMEGEIDSVLGATGAIYAIRREFFVPLDPDTVLDDVVVPMRIVLAGKRAVFESRARAYDRVAETPEDEYRRKVRTLMGNYQLLALMPELLSPRCNPVWLQFVSHKLGRLVVPYFLVLLLAANFFALHGVYLLLFVCQTAWYGLALLGRFLPRQAAALRAVAGAGSRGNAVRKALLFPYTYAVLNRASVAALYHILRGTKSGKEVWLKYRKPPGEILVAEQLRQQRLAEAPDAVPEEAGRPV